MAAWTINGDGSPASVEADGVNGSPPTLNPGESGTFEFWFVDQEPSDDHVQRFRDARAFTVTAEQYDTYEQIESGVWYWREQVADGPSPLVEIVPPAHLPTSRRIWALVEGVEATTSTPHARCILSVSLIKLANSGTEPGAFETEAALRAARHVTGP